MICAFVLFPIGFSLLEPRIQIRGKELKERFDQLRGEREPATFLSLLLDQHEQALAGMPEVPRITGNIRTGSSDPEISKRTRSTRRKQTLMALHNIHGASKEDVIGGLEDFLNVETSIGNPVTQSMKEEVRQETISDVKEKFPLEKVIEMIDDARGSMNVTSWIRLRKECPEVFPSENRIVKARKYVESLGAKVAPLMQTANKKGWWVDPRDLINYLRSSEPSQNLVIASFDGNYILKKQSLLAALRLLPKIAYSEKLQNASDVWTLLRCWGTDDKVEGREQLREPFQRLVTYAAENSLECEDPCFLVSLFPCFHVLILFSFSPVAYQLDMKAMMMALDRGGAAGKVENFCCVCPCTKGSRATLMVQTSNGKFVSLGFEEAWEHYNKYKNLDAFVPKRFEVDDKARFPFHSFHLHDFINSSSWNLRLVRKPSLESRPKRSSCALCTLRSGLSPMP